MPEQVTKEDRVSAMLAARRSGRSYESIAAEFGTSAATVGRLCRKEDLGSGRIRPSTPDDIYGGKWFARIVARCTVDANGCWLWPGSKSGNGYGQTNWRGRTVRIHRQVYSLIHGQQLTPEQDVCHRCDVRHCCNPDHLWLGDAHANLTDSVVKKRHRCARATECPRGHAYDDKNTYVTPYGARACKTCSRARQRIRDGWPPELAYSTARVPSGYSREVLL